MISADVMFWSGERPGEKVVAILGVYRKKKTI